MQGFGEVAHDGATAGLDVNAGGHAVFEHVGAQLGVGCCGAELDVCPVVAGADAGGAGFVEGVGADVGEHALQGAVGAVVEGVKFDGHGQAGVQLADVGGVDLGFDDHVAVGGGDLHQFVPSTKHTTDGVDLEVFDDASGGGGQLGVLEHALAFFEFVLVGGQFVFEPDDFLPCFLLVFVEYRLQAAFDFAHLPLCAQHLDFADVARFEKVQVELVFFEGQFQGQALGLQFIVECLAPLLVVGHLRLDELRVALQRGCKHRWALLCFCMGAHQGGLHRGHFGLGFRVGGVAAVFFEQGQALACLHDLAFMDEDF